MNLIQVWVIEELSS